VAWHLLSHGLVTVVSVATRLSDRSSPRPRWIGKVDRAEWIDGFLVGVDPD